MIQVLKLPTVFGSDSETKENFNSFMAKGPIIKKPIINLLCKLMDWFLHDRDLHHGRVKKHIYTQNLNVSHKIGLQRVKQLIQIF